MGFQQRRQQQRRCWRQHQCGEQQPRRRQRWCREQHTAAGSGSSNATYLFNAATVAQNKGALAATSGLPVSELSKARVQPGSALWQRLLQLAVPSCDALDAARAAPMLITLAGDSFVAALGLAGVNILRADLVPRIKEGEDLGWLRHIIGLAEDNEAGALLLAAAEELGARCGSSDLSHGRPESWKT
ncbi:hypothetical protein ABPG77_002690 [Micractinium sp. CCAP 211/92]